MPNVYSLLVVVFLLVPLSAVHAEPPVPLATGEWAPFTSQNMSQQGVVTALVSDVFTRMGREPEISFFPWNRCYNLVLQGKVWGAFPYSWTPKRAKEVLFSEPVSFSDTAWYHVGEPPVRGYEKLEELRHLHIAGVAGYFYKEDLDQAGLQVEYAPDEASAFRMLLAGRVDLAPMNVLVAEAIIDEHFPEHKDAFRRLDELYSRNDLRLIVSPHYPQAKELLDAFNKALAITGPVDPEKAAKEPASE